MPNPLKELALKLDEIKEAWQIYAIFEEAQKSFEEEFKALQKDKESLIQSFNDISAKHALLLSQNKELEKKNAALIHNNTALENAQTPQEIQNSLKLLESKDWASLFAQCKELQECLKITQESLKNLPSLEPLKKVEVFYQKHQRLLANPANSYVQLEKAQELLTRLLQVESRLNALDLDFAKLQIEMRDLLRDAQIQQPPKSNTKATKDSINSEILDSIDSTHNDNSCNQ